MLARSACGRSPESSTTISPVCMSVAMARNGIGSLSKSRTPRLRETSRPMRLLDVLRVYEAAGRREPAVAKAELEAIAVDVTCELPAHRLVPALALEADRLLEGNPADRGVDLGSGQSRCVGAAHQRAHARADDAVDRDAQLLEHRQHADVRGALGAAAAQRQTDAWACGRRCGRGRHPRAPFRPRPRPPAPSVPQRRAQ